MIPTGWWTSIDSTLNAAPFFCGVFTSICSHAHLPAQMRRKGRQIPCCRSSIVPTSTSLNFDALTALKLGPHVKRHCAGHAKARFRHTHNSFALTRGQEKRRKMQEDIVKALRLPRNINLAFGFDPPRSASILSEMPRLSRFGMVRVRFRPPVL